MSFTSAISWFEIPTTDLERAQRFYESVFENKRFGISAGQRQTKNDQHACSHLLSVIYFPSHRYPLHGVAV